VATSLAVITPAVAVPAPSKPTSPTTIQFAHFMSRLSFEDD
jgi:hypothetical protein